MIITVKMVIITVEMMIITNRDDDHNCRDDDHNNRDDDLDHNSGDDDHNNRDDDYHNSRDDDHNNRKMITFLCFLCLMLAVRLSVGWNRLRPGLGAGLELAWADFTLLVSRRSGLTRNDHVVMMTLSMMMSLWRYVSPRVTEVRSH